jgi:hypothetical protein
MRVLTTAFQPAKMGPRVHLCNVVVDKGYKDEAESGFIIRKYLDEEGIKMLEELEHNPIEDTGKF